MTESGYATATVPGKAPRRSSRLTEREKLEGRLHAALVNGGASAVTPRGDGRFKVVGRAGDRYTVPRRPPSPCVMPSTEQSP